MQFNAFYTWQTKFLNSTTDDKLREIKTAPAHWETSCDKSSVILLTVKRMQSDNLQLEFKQSTLPASIRSMSKLVMDNIKLDKKELGNLNNAANRYIVLYSQ